MKCTDNILQDIDLVNRLAEIETETNPCSDQELENHLSRVENEMNIKRSEDLVNFFGVEL